MTKNIMFKRRYLKSTRTKNAEREREREKGREREREREREVPLWGGARIPQPSA